MSPKTPDITGKRFGRWVVLHRCGSKSYGGSAWACICDCGSAKVLSGQVLWRGVSKSCGCLGREERATRASVHGLRGHPLYRTWCGMRERCYRPRHAFYFRYGGRGITVCERWQDFRAFYADNLPKWAPHLSLDRTDNDGDYSPENTRWSDRFVQARNKRNTVWMTLNGETRALAEWAERTGISQRALRQRRTSGWTDIRALTTPWRVRARQA